MTFLEWDWFVKKYGSEKAVGPEGEWLISERQKNEVYDVKYQLPMFNGRDEYLALKAEFASIPNTNNGFWPKRKQYIHAQMGTHQELGFAQSRFEAKRLIEFIREGDAGLPPLEEMLAANDFEARFHHKNSVTWQHKTLRLLSISVTDEDFYVRYDSTNGGYWYNIMHLEGTDTGFDGQTVIYKFYPPSVTGDQRRIGMRFLEWLIKERRERGGKFNVPLR